jgi:hypothetical protein
MKCNAINATLALAVLGCVNLLTGCKAAPNATEPTQAYLARAEGHAAPIAEPVVVAQTAP